MNKKIQEVLSLISDEDIRILVDASITRNYQDFITQPAACGNHHSYEGGLLVHSHSTALLAARIADHFLEKEPKLNRDVVIAGAFMHDIGKVLCYNKNPDKEKVAKKPYVPTEESMLFHHIPIGFHIVASTAEIYNIPKEKYYPILHIIISHHGRLEYHSPVVPKTPEAFIVHKADYLDAYIDASPEMRGLYK